MSHHPRGGIAASSQKMQRGLESTVLEKAQISPVFIKPAKTEMSPLWSQTMQPWGQGMCVALLGEELSCPWVQDWGMISETSLKNRFLLNKTRFCEEELLPAVRIYRLRSCACTSGVEVQTSTDMSELIFS